MRNSLDFREVCEQEVSAFGIDSCVTGFDYSDREWAEIELSAQAAQPGPLTSKARQRLRQAGAVYKALYSTGTKFLQQQELKFAKKWQKVGYQASELSLELSSADPWNYAELQLLLAKLQDEASTRLSTCSSLRLREDYYREIFGVWIDELGGHLGVSRDTYTHKLGGPLVRFFQSVVRPVLGSASPAVETISHIVEREKERRKPIRETTVQVSKPRHNPSHRLDSQGHYKDLGPLRINPKSSIDDQVRKYIVERARNTGLKHIVAVDRNGVVIAHGCGKERSIIFPQTLAEALFDPKSRIVLHATRSPNGFLHPSDTAFLALPGLEAIWVHGAWGSSARGALTPKGRALLKRNAPKEAQQMLFRIAAGIGLKCYDVLDEAIRAGTISKYQADSAYYHLVCLTLSEFGVLAYSIESTQKIGRSGVDVTEFDSR